MEAVRHVLANMSIDDALKKKDDISENLKGQLKKFEQRWGILFDQVGIEKVHIMSSQLFEDLQAEYRNQLHLEVSKAKIRTDREIAVAENAMREQTETERLSTERKLSLAEAESRSEVGSDKLEKEQVLFEQERLIHEDRFRKEADFRIEQNRRDYEAQMKEQELRRRLQELEGDVLRSEAELEELRVRIAAGKLDLKERERLIEETHTPEQLTREFIHKLPSLYEGLSIDNYSVMDTGSGGLSPVSRVLQEAIGLLRGNGLEGLLDRAAGVGTTGSGPVTAVRPAKTGEYEPPAELEELPPEDE